MRQDNERYTPDHESDPAGTPGDGWGGEGGASYLGPATHLESGHPHEGDESDEGAAEVGTDEGTDESGK